MNTGYLGRVRDTAKQTRSLSVILFRPRAGSAFLTFLRIARMPAALAVVLRVSCAVEVRDSIMRLATTLRTPLSGAEVEAPGYSAPAGAARATAGAEASAAWATRPASATLTRPPMPVPSVAWTPAARAAEVRTGPAAIAAATSRSMTRPWGPEPSEIAEASTPAEAARARARGETAPVARSVAKAGAAACSGAACSTGASSAGASPPGTRPEMSSPGAPTMMRGSLTGTSSPSSHRSFRTVPSAVEGTSIVDLSVSMDARVWSTATVSPSAIIHSTMMHDSTELPSWGITTMVAM